ncbi:dihydrolipoamide acetyltransferase family protein [Confluentibacter flavum]|uniref:Dihydrolipoamide acetyltransferase component of pyruvate dehydrogenase complex n=1 Tax=Confluentibacter flavum TaxID=1909700 RepID=A0A2N3HPQ0_9FLAO|nr:dihydrolipoamide acetyltransferase family protein [Confluentibacter flavum]PKQ46949.1 diapophytoene dehydrogenase [Confluentibacter flavum]
MAKFELKLPKMGESVAEATITSWLKEVGDTIELDEAVLEIATDKVDSEVPSEVEGVLIEKRFNIDDVVQVGQVIAIIETEADVEQEPSSSFEEPELMEAVEHVSQTIQAAKETVSPLASSDGRFYSPLVKNIAKQEGISQLELDTISGSGKEGRVTKDDILGYIENKSNGQNTFESKIDTSLHQVKEDNVITETAPIQSKVESLIEDTPIIQNTIPIQETPKLTQTPIMPGGEDEIIEMTRMGKLISHHMMESIQTSAHVQSFIEADVTKIWNWRQKVKDDFMKRTGENLTFTPIFMEAIAKALRDYPMMNISVQGDKIIKKKNINLGMAASLPNGNLIVPVIKNADQLNLFGMTKQVNDLANRAKTGKLKPDDTHGGTYTVTNVGSFGSIMGTPIINQPQVGILALGAIRKTPAVIETAEGDFIGIRYKMFLSHSYDHRVVNGALGGQFVKAVKDYLEAWDSHREI